LGGFAIGARVALLGQHNANPSYKLASIPLYDGIVRTAGWAGSARAAGRWLAGDRGRSQNCAPYMGSGRGWLAGDWRSGVLNITAAAWTSGFLWWRSGNKKRTQNVSEYMLVLALCLVWVMHLVGSKEASVSGYTLAQPGECHITIHLRRRCGLFVKFLWPLVTIVIVALPSVLQHGWVAGRASSL